MSRISRRSLVGGALLVPIAGVGLRGATASRQDSEPEASPGASPAASPMASPAAGGDGEEVHVLAEDIAYDQTEITIPANTDVTITLENVGVLEHDLVIEDLDLATDLLAGGETDSITVNAEAGEYEYHCTVAGHREAGMVGTLIVE